MHIEEIADLLLLLPELIGQQERYAPDFASNANAWLTSLEKIFLAGRLYQAGTIATIRSNLVAVEQGQVPSGIEFRGRLTRTRVRNSVASQALQRAADLASALLAENKPRLAEGERVAHQITAVALSRDLVMTRDPVMSNTQYLQMLRRSLSLHNDLELAFVHLEGLVGPHDALVLFDRALASHLKTYSLTPMS